MTQTPNPSPAPDAAQAPQVLMLTSDLMFLSRVSSVVERAGGRLEMVGSAEAARQRAERQAVCLLILDLTWSGGGPAQVLDLWNGLPDPPPVVAYGPHVAAGQLEAAQRAGCREVLTRGQFDRQLPDLISRYLAG